MEKQNRVTGYPLRKFSPIDRETPVIEMLFKEEIIMDLLKNEANGKYEIMFYRTISDKSVELDLLEEIIGKGKSQIEGV